MSNKEKEDLQEAEAAIKIIFDLHKNEETKKEELKNLDYFKNTLLAIPADLSRIEKVHLKTSVTKIHIKTGTFPPLNISTTSIIYSITECLNTDKPTSQDPNSTEFSSAASKFAENLLRTTKSQLEAIQRDENLTTLPQYSIYTKPPRGGAKEKSLKECGIEIYKIVLYIIKNILTTHQVNKNLFNQLPLAPTCIAAESNVQENISIAEVEKEFYNHLIQDPNKKQKSLNILTRAIDKEFTLIKNKINASNVPEEAKDNKLGKDEILEFDLEIYSLLKELLTKLFTNNLFYDDMARIDLITMKEADMKSKLIEAKVDDVLFTKKQELITPVSSYVKKFLRKEIFQLIPKIQDFSKIYSSDENDADSEEDDSNNLQDYDIDFYPRRPVLIENDKLILPNLPKWNKKNDLLEHIKTVHEISCQQQKLYQNHNLFLALFYIFELQEDQRKFMTIFNDIDQSTRLTYQQYSQKLQKFLKIFDPRPPKAAKYYANWIAQGPKQKEQQSLQDFSFSLHHALKKGYPNESDTKEKKILIIVAFLEGLRDEQLKHYMDNNNTAMDLMRKYDFEKYVKHAIKFEKYTKLKTNNAPTPVSYPVSQTSSSSHTAPKSPNQIKTYSIQSNIPENFTSQSNSQNQIQRSTNSNINFDYQTSPKKSHLLPGYKNMFRYLLEVRVQNYNSSKGRQPKEKIPTETFEYFKKEVYALLKENKITPNKKESNLSLHQSNYSSSNIQRNTPSSHSSSNYKHINDDRYLDRPHDDQYQSKSRYNNDRKTHKSISHKSRRNRRNNSRSPSSNSSISNYH